MSLRKSTAGLSSAPPAIAKKSSPHPTLTRSGSKGQILARRASESIKDSQPNTGGPQFVRSNPLQRVSVSTRFSGLLGGQSIVGFRGAKGDNKPAGADAAKLPSRTHQPPLIL